MIGLKKVNDKFAERLSYALSTMAMFYGVAFLVVAPLFFQHPTTPVAWIQYVVSVFFQGVALPVLGYTSRKSGETQARMLQETHDTVMAELQLMKEDAAGDKEEIALLKQIIQEIHEHTVQKE